MYTFKHCFAVVVFLCGCSTGITPVAVDEQGSVSDSGGPDAASSTPNVDASRNSVVHQTDPGSVTMGPYTWPTGKNTSRLASFQPEHRFCWATLRATPSQEFPNPQDTLGHGPMEIAYLSDLKVAGHRLNHDDWRGRVNEVTAGKTALVTLYPEENFGGEPHIVHPGTEFKLEGSNLVKVGSLRIEYQPLGDNE